MGGDRRELVAQAGVGGARGDAPLAAVLAGGQVGRAVGAGLELGPVDDDTQIVGVEGGEAVAPGGEAGREDGPGGGAPEEVGVGLGEPDRQAGAATVACRRSAVRRGRRSGRGPAAAGGEEGDGQAGERRPADQTGEQDSVPATRKEDPQPQAATTLGLLTLNPAPIRAST